MKAKSFLYGGESPDAENCIKESVGALEGMSRILFNESKTLSELLPKVKAKYLGHPAMEKIFGSLYAVRGDAPGVAHGSHEESKLTFTDAEFVFNACMACMIYRYRLRIKLWVVHS